ncbi:hypothetical protein LCGC14_2724210, partial [marine sediment metagenome]
CTISMRAKMNASGKNAIRQVTICDGKPTTAHAYIDYPHVRNNFKYNTTTIRGWPENTGLTLEEFVNLFDRMLGTFKFPD